MKRTTIFANEDMLRALRQIAQREGLSMAEVIRQALDQFIAKQQGGNKLPSFLGIGRSGRRDIAERCEELLWQAESPTKKVPR
jgi:hypothetical protein